MCDVAHVYNVHNAKKSLKEHVALQNKFLHLKENSHLRYMQHIVAKPSEYRASLYVRGTASPSAVVNFVL